MDRRRAAGALLALAVCVASSDAAPTASNQTALDLYDGAAEGCYYNFQHYGEGDRIMTNEPCLNCTCHNRMLMCYLRVCPFTKPIGQDCTVEKRADQCCPIVTCPDVPVDLLTSTSTTSPAEYGGTGVGKLDKYGCSINGKYFPEGSKVPPTPNKPCEHCYCIRNMTTCVMQECTLHVDGCTPIYHKDVCCPVRYSCDHPEDEMLLLDDMTTTVRPTPGFLLTTTTLSPVTQMSQDCVHEDKIVPDGALIKTDKACEHCYCMKGDIVCVVQECGTPMENEGKNCTSQPPREGQCCPDTYICEGDEIATEMPSEFTTEPFVTDEITTLSPPRRVGVEGSGYRKETEESYTEIPLFETDTEGSGYDHETPHHETPHQETPDHETPDTETHVTSEVISETTEDLFYIASSTQKTPTLEEIEKTTEPDKGLNTVPSGLFDEETSEAPHKTTISEGMKITEEPIVTGEDASKDKTMIPELPTTPEITNKEEVIPTSTESAYRKEDEINEVTDHYEHIDHEKLSTPPAQTVEQTTTLIKYTTLEAESPIDENKVDLTTEIMPTADYKPTEDKETTQPDTEIGTSDSLIKTPGEISTDDTSLPNEVTTRASLDASISEEVTKADVIDDVTKQKDVSTESLMESSTSSSKIDDTIKEEEVSTKSMFDQEDDTMKEEVTTQSFVDVSTPVDAVKATSVVSHDVTVKYSEITTESLLEVSTASEFTKSSDDLEKPIEEKEHITESPIEPVTSTQGKEATTESLLEVSTASEFTKSSDAEKPIEEKELITKSPVEPVTSTQGKEVTTESLLEVSTASEFIKSSDDAEKPIEEIEHITKSSVEPVTSTQGKEETTESLLEVSTASEFIKSSVDAEKPIEEKEQITKSPEESVTSTQGKEETTESLLEHSTYAATTKHPEEISFDQDKTDDKEATTESLLETSPFIKVPTPSETLASTVTEKSDDILPTTDKASLPETTIIDNQENEVEGYARIPGEGDCLLNGITYRNNSEVPSTNNCHTSCKCVSSIVKCDPIICSPPPEYMDNCQPTYDSPDSCCPTYICHTGETMPPQPDSHMSGTEKPVPPSTSECHGDQCIIKQDEESPAPSEKPVVSDCGSTSCGDEVLTHPHIPPTDKISSDCDGQECLPPKESCDGETCQAATPEKPCVGDNCDIEAVIVPVKDIPLCQNKEDCQPQVIPCEGDACKPAECSGPDCSPIAIPIPTEKDQKPELCDDSSDCQKQEDEAKLPCSDESCRRKETGEELENVLPIDCTGSECEKQKPEVSAEKVEHHTDLPELLTTPEKSSSESAQQTDKSPVDIQTEITTEYKLPETITDKMITTQETSSKSPQEKEEIPIEVTTENELPETMTDMILTQAETSSESPQQTKETPVDIPIKTSIEDVSTPTETTTEILIIREETSSESTLHTDELPIDKDKEAPSSETVSTTIKPSAEHSTSKPDFDEPLSESSTPEISESAETTVKPYLSTEFEELLTNTDSTSQFEHATSSSHPSVTQPVSEEKITQSGEVTEMSKPTTITSEDYDQTSRVPEKQPSIKPSEQAATEGEKSETDEVFASQHPEIFESSTEPLQTSVTESHEAHTTSSLDGISEIPKETIPTVSENITKLPHSETEIVKESTESPEQITPESQDSTKSTISNLDETEHEGYTKSPEEEKETVTLKAQSPQQTDESTTKKQVTPVEAIEGSTLSPETVTDSYKPIDKSTGSLPYDEADVTTSTSPRDVYSETTESYEVTKKLTTLPEVPMITESERDIVTTEATKQEDEESASESHSTKPEERKTEAPISKIPSLPEDKTDTTFVDYSPTLGPETLVTEKEKESSEIPVTIPYEETTPIKELTTEKEEDTEIKTDSPATDKPIKETTKEDMHIPTESPLTNQDTEYPATPASETYEEMSSTTLSISIDSESISTKSPDVTNVPSDIGDTTEIVEDKTTQKVVESEVTKKPWPSDDKIETQEPLSEVTESVTDRSHTESTKLQSTEGVEEHTETKEPSHVTEKNTVEETPEVTDIKDTTAKQPAESPIPTASIITEDIATEVYQTTIVDHDKEKVPGQIEEKEEITTTSSAQSHTEPQHSETELPSTGLVTSLPEIPQQGTQTTEVPQHLVTEAETIIGDGLGESPSTDDDTIYASTQVPDEFVSEKETELPDTLFTTKKSDISDLTTKTFTEEPDTVTEIPVIITDQEKESEIPIIPDLGPKIHNQTEEPSLSTNAPTSIPSVDETSTQSSVVLPETSTKIAEPAITEAVLQFTTNIPESHVKDQELDSHLDVTTSSDIQTSSSHEEPSKSTHSTISELQTEEFMEVTKKPVTESYTVSTDSKSDITEAVQKEVATEKPFESTTAEISDITSGLYKDKTTEQTAEVFTKAPHEIVPEEPYVTDKYPDDTKEVYTDKTQEPSITEPTIHDEKTTVKSDESVTEDLQEVVTKITPDEGLKETQSTVELTTKSVTEIEDIIEPEIMVTSAPYEKTTEASQEPITEEQPTITENVSEKKDSKYDITTEIPEVSTIAYESVTTAHVIDEEVSTLVPDVSTKLPDQEIVKTEVEEATEPKHEITETTPYVVELEEHTHKTVEESSLPPEDIESESKPTLELTTEKHSDIEGPSEHKKDQYTTRLPEYESTKLSDYEPEKSSTPSYVPTKEFISEITTPSYEAPVDKHDDIPSSPVQPSSETESPLSQSAGTEMPLKTDKVPDSDRIPEEEMLHVTSKATTTKVEEDIATPSPVFKPEEKPIDKVPSTSVPETPKPGLNEVLPTDEIPEDEGHFPSGGPSGYGQEPDYVEEDQAFGPGTCRYGGKVYVSAQQIPRDDPCDFCFCFRSDIICLQQSCPPPIHGCHEEPIQGFCCPRYECPVAMATSLNVTTTTTTTTTTLPPHFLPHAYKGAAQRRGCQIKGHTYKVGEVVRASSGPCLHCTCGGDGQMKCDPKACTPEPMLRQMIAAAVSAKRRR
ncbi:unnamed protein product [Chilo suppressalis]|uniref:VWFC domain-containing protein n=1 Tax=Chilo suppressalis TaxID=168631 RepID=A0ABN8LB14_CHISP|nr:unnamed protein product [Chilo suppressalis]